MENQKPTAGKFAMNYGIILGVIMLAISVTMYVTGMALEGVQWPSIEEETPFAAMDQCRHCHGPTSKSGAPHIPFGDNQKLKQWLKGGGLEEVQRRIHLKGPGQMPPGGLDAAQVEHLESALEALAL